MSSVGFIGRAGYKERDVSGNRHAGPVKCNALLAAANALVKRLPLATSSDDRSPSFSAERS
jgi:hypothetical protein